MGEGGGWGGCTAHASNPFTKVYKGPVSHSRLACFATLSNPAHWFDRWSRVQEEQHDSLAEVGCGVCRRELFSSI